MRVCGATWRLLVSLLTKPSSTDNSSGARQLPRDTTPPQGGLRVTWHHNGVNPMNKENGNFAMYATTKEWRFGEQCRRLAIVFFRGSLRRADGRLACSACRALRLHGAITPGVPDRPRPPSQTRHSTGPGPGRVRPPHRSV